MKVCIVGASGKLGKYMVQHCLDQGHTVVGVCRPESAHKLEGLPITVVPGRTNNAQVIQEAVRGCDGVLAVLAPWGRDDYSSGTAAAILKHAEPHARLVFSCGWHVSLDGQDQFSVAFRVFLWLATWAAWLARFADIKDQLRATDMIFASDRRWTVVRGSDLEEGPSEGLPVWSEHVQDASIAHNITRRVDFALFMVHALTNDGLVGKAPAIASCRMAAQAA